MGPDGRHGSASPRATERRVSGVKKVKKVKKRRREIFLTRPGLGAGFTGITRRWAWPVPHGGRLARPEARLHPRYPALGLRGGLHWNHPALGLARAWPS